jgi:hypothetical protein
LRSSGRSAARARDKVTHTRGKASEKILAFKLPMVDQEAEKKVALSTIWINYLDLRWAALSRNRRSCSYLFDQVIFFFFAHRMAAA